MTYANEIFPRESIAALANNDPDYPGSCGRCYEVRCHTGPVIANGTEVYRTDHGCAALRSQERDAAGKRALPPGILHWNRIFSAIL